MALSAETSNVSKLSAIVQSLSRQTGDDLAARFAKHLFNEVDTAEFETYGTSDLVAFACDAFESIRQREPGEPKIVLRKSVAGGVACRRYRQRRHAFPSQLSAWRAARARPCA